MIDKEMLDRIIELAGKVSRDKPVSGATCDEMEEYWRLLSPDVVCELASFYRDGKYASTEQEELNRLANMISCLPNTVVYDITYDNGMPVIPLDMKSRQSMDILARAVNSQNKWWTLRLISGTRLELVSRKRSSYRVDRTSGCLVRELKAEMESRELY